MTKDAEGNTVPAMELIDDIVEVKIFDNFSLQCLEKGFQAAAYEYLKTLPEFADAIDD